MKITTPCIIWSGATLETHGNTYGLVGKRGIAHRIAYEKAKGKIPNGFVIDHLCRNGLCINPDHLEAVTNKVNILRGNGQCALNARKTHCKRGHPLLPENLLTKPGKRDCKLCNNIRRKENKAKKKLDLGK